MDLIVWRHAEAVDDGHGIPGEDLARQLTSKGERQADRMAAWLNNRMAQSTRILVSPALRCQQTAKALGRKFRTVDALAPGASAEDVLLAARWPGGAEPVLVVGHQPALGLAVALAVAGSAEPWSMKKAGVWWLRHRASAVEAGVARTLVWAVQSPDAL